MTATPTTRFDHSAAKEDLKMRITTPIIAAAALLVAAPAIAQDDNAATNVAAVTTNAVDANAVDANAMTPADDAAMAANQTAVMPVDDNVAMVDTSVGEPAPAPKRGFPWGLLGLIGLIGLIPRTGSRRG
jgi:hypothetical protein